jgi:soluble lytic murein transglycosylase-like protein
VENAKKYNIDAKVLFTIINIESAFNPFAIAVETNKASAMKLKKLQSDNIKIMIGKTYHSKIWLVSIFPKNESDAIFIISLLKDLGFCFDVGLMQINSGNFSKKEVAKMLYPSYNINKGTRILKQCTQMFKDFKHQIECYNRGAGNLRKSLRKGKKYSPYFQQYMKKWKQEF